MEKNKSTQRLTLLHGRAAKGTKEALRAQAEKILELAPRERKDAVLESADPAALVQALEPLELLMTVKELGLEEGAAVLALSSPAQFRFCLDMELWEKWTFRGDEAARWLELLLEEGEERVVEVVDGVEPEFLVLLLKGHVDVAGGVGDIMDDEQRLAEWDHTFDNMYYLTFLSPKTSRAVGTFLDILFRQRQELYLQIMEGIKNETVTELEELCWRMRGGRLQDEGFPDPEEAPLIYAWMDPDAYAPPAEKLAPEMPPDLHPARAEDGLLAAVLAADATGTLALELRHLLNAAVLADDVDLAQREEVDRVSRRIRGCLEIALEHLSGGDVDAACRAATADSVTNLFRLGHSMLLRLQRRARGISGDLYPTSRLLEGLRERHPRMYRGLDADRVDDFREFTTLADVRTVAAVIDQLQD